MKNCAQCQESFEVTNQDRSFYQTMEVPEPTHCPDCRLMRRMSYMNTRNFFLRSLNPGEKPVVSMYSQDINLKIVDDKKWWSDEIDFFEYGRDYDFNKPFFEQFEALKNKVPMPHLQRNFETFENSNYCNAASALKNCYLIANADNNESCMFGFCIEDSKFCQDVLFTNQSELCYESINLKNCYDCKYSKDCEDSSGLLFSEDCVGCRDCFGCVGLRQKSYHIFNKPYSKEDYEAKMKELNLSSYKTLQEARNRVKEFQQTIPRKHIHGRQNEQVSGDYIYQSKNTHSTFVAERCENCKFCHLLRYLDKGTNNAYDYTMFGVGADWIYESAWVGLGVQNLKFCMWTYGASNQQYSVGCHFSHDMFGSIGLRHKKYCILNKQYSKEEYEALLPKIIEHMRSTGEYGEFFPSKMSPFAYNQTLAQDYFPKKKIQADTWYSQTDRGAKDFIGWQELPDAIIEVDDEICSRPIKCKAYDEDPELAEVHNCSQYFKIIPQELKFYKKSGIPLPRHCPNTRHRQRLDQMNPFKLWDRQCAKCLTPIHTSYAPGQSEKVYCEKCYLAETY